MYAVHNSVSETSDAESVREKFAQAPGKRGIPFEIYQTTGEDDLHDLVKKAMLNVILPVRKA